ncbi:MAG: hypothetical protein AAFR98_01985, partial [Pseudomonadota bacterium]
NREYGMKQTQKVAKPRKLRSFLVTLPEDRLRRARISGSETHCMSALSATKEERTLQKNRLTGIGRLAKQALKRVAISDDIVRQLIDAGLNDDPKVLREVSNALQKAGLSKSDLVTKAIPAALHAMGEEWVFDRMSWVDVSIASSRLQALISEIQIRQIADTPAPGRILILVPEGEDHTAVASLLQKRFEILGHFSEVILGATVSHLTEHAALNRFDLIAMSASHGDAVPALVRLANKIRELAPETVIALGGHIITLPLPAELNVDIVTNDLTLVLEKAGLPGAAVTETALQENYKNDT